MSQPINVDNLCRGCMSRLDKKNLFCPYCGFSESHYAPSPHQLPLNTILNGKYLIGRVLGEGGFGRVQRLRNTCKTITGKFLYLRH